MSSHSKSMQKNNTSQVKKVMRITGKFRGVYKDISYQHMNQLYILCVRPIFEYGIPVWYHKLTDQWKDEIQNVQNTGSRKILEAFKSAPVKAMQCDADILPVKCEWKKSMTDLPFQLFQLWVLGIL